MIRKPKPPKWRNFTRKEVKQNPVTFKPLFGKPYTLHFVEDKVIDGFRPKGTLTT